MTIETLIKKTLKECLLEALRSQRKAIKEGESFVPYEPQENIRVSDLSKADRLDIGKKHEKNILDILSEYGKIKLASFQEDVNYKLDGFITFPENSKEFSEYKGKTVSVQVKKRTQSGNDILFEVEKDFNNKIIGRDQKGMSELYAVSDQNGRVVVCKTAFIKELVKELLDKESKNLEKFRKEEHRLGVVSRINGAELRVTEGKLSYDEGIRKLIAFIKFEYSNPILLISTSKQDNTPEETEEQKAAKAKEAERKAAMAAKKAAYDAMKKAEAERWSKGNR